jgi:predicted aspartyl protease
MLLVGAFDEAGNATVRIRVSGELGAIDYTAIIDTGFSGFVALPLVDIVPLGFSTEPAAASVMLGNGTIIPNLVAQGNVTLGGQTETGAVLLDDTSNDVLVGMAFLRKFKLALIVTDTAVVLYDKEEILEAIAEFMGTVPLGTPNLTQGKDNE